MHTGRLYNVYIILFILEKKGLTLGICDTTDCQTLNSTLPPRRYPYGQVWKRLSSNCFTVMCIQVHVEVRRPPHVLLLKHSPLKPGLSVCLSSAGTTVPPHPATIFNSSLEISLRPSGSFLAESSSQTPVISLWKCLFTKTTYQSTKSSI